MADFYELLGVSKTASGDEIKRAFRGLARDLHPDRNPGDAEAEARFKEVARAYETLSNPEKRAHYDRYGDAEPGANPFDGASFGDIFEAFFGGGSPFGGGFGGQSAGPQTRGDDLEVVIDVPFEGAVLGSEQPVDVRTHVPCESCEATGQTDRSTVATCDTCGGQGQVRQVRRSILGQMVTTGICPQCSGAGEIIESPCGDCAGDGRVVERRTYTVDVPAGVDSGATLRLSGRGGAGQRGAGFGDLYVRIRVQPHKRFERQGNDLIAELGIPMTIAALGGEIDVDTLEGTEVVPIAVGTQTGKVMRIPGQGVPSLQGGRRGDIRLVAIVVVPEKLTDEQEDLLRQFAAARGDEVNESRSLLSRIRSALG